MNKSIFTEPFQTLCDIAYCRVRLYFAVLKAGVLSQMRNVIDVATLLAYFRGDNENGTMK